MSAPREHPASAEAASRGWSAAATTARSTPLGVSPAPAGPPTQTFGERASATMPPASEAIETCPLCGAPLLAQQEWCLRCGGAARTRLAAAPNWRAPLLTLVVLAALSLGVLTAALVKLAGGSGSAAGPAVRTGAAAPVASAPAPTTPAPTTPAPGATLPAASTPTVARPRASGGTSPQASARSRGSPSRARRNQRRGGTKVAPLSVPSGLNLGPTGSRNPGQVVRERIRELAKKLRR